MRRGFCEIVGMRAAPTLFLAVLTQVVTNAVGLLWASLSPTYEGGRGGWEIVFNFVLWTCFACVLALVTWPVAWLLLRRKEPRRAARDWLATSGVLAFCFVPWPPLMGLLLFTPLASVLAAAITSVRLPVVYPDPRLCYKCGYDLTCNVSGVCPECGRPIEKAL
jgi:hypothetical protein